MTRPGRRSVRPTRETRMPGPIRPPHPPPGPPAQVLLVDDEPGNLLALEALLDDLGHRLVRASSGEEAVRRLAEDDFALVLLDVRMPGMDGFEAAERMRAQDRSRSTPIIFVSAQD